MRSVGRDIATGRATRYLEWWLYGGLRARVTALYRGSSEWAWSHREVRKALWWARRDDGWPRRGGIVRHWRDGPLTMPLLEFLRVIDGK